MKRIISLVLILIISNPAYSQTFMTEEEMMATMLNVTISGISIQDDETRWSFIAHPHKKGKPKGRIDGIFGGEPYKSKWYIKKGMWCENWGEGEACWKLEMVDDATILPYRDGKGALRNPWKIEIES